MKLCCPYMVGPLHSRCPLCSKSQTSASMSHERLYERTQCGSGGSTLANAHHVGMQNLSGEATAGIYKVAISAEKMVSGPLEFIATEVSDLARWPIASSSACKSADDWPALVSLLLPKSLRDILVIPATALFAIYRRSEPASNFHPRPRYRVFSSSRSTPGGLGAYVM